MDTIKDCNAYLVEPSRQVRITRQYDVLVLGGGPSGLIAALAAAESGLRVCLVENRSFVGCNLTIGIPILCFLGQKGNQIIYGLPEKFIERLREVHGASAHQRCPLHVSITFLEPEAVKDVALQMLLEAKVDVTLHTAVSSVIMDGDKISGIVVQGKQGREAYTAHTYIDCTGDADVAFAAGVPTEKGDENGGLQPPTLMFSMNNVDTGKLRKALAEQPETYKADFIPSEYFGSHEKFIVVGMRKQILDAQAAGIQISTDRIIIITGLGKDEAWINMTRPRGVDGSDSHSLTDGEIESRKQMSGIIAMLQQFVPGFENSALGKCASFLGIRESRHILGEYVINRDDILGCRHFDDAIGVASYPIDLHHPNDNDCTMEWCGDCYDIPYRSLVPLKVSNLLVAGRTISMTHEALAALRVMSSCMVMGEAAGRAAALCVANNIAPKNVDVTRLRQELKAKGVYLREAESK